MVVHVIQGSSLFYVHKINKKKTVSKTTKKAKQYNAQCCDLYQAKAAKLLSLIVQYVIYVV